MRHRENKMKGITFEDLHGEVLEHEAYQDAVDKAECEAKCFYSYMDYHRLTCPLRSIVDDRYEEKVQGGIDISRGK